MNTRDITDVPKYEKIAIDIATKIFRKEYNEGCKIYGRSTLSSQYNVSPETIRRSVALLQSMGIVKVIAGSGIHIEDRNAAKQYLDSFNHKRGLIQAREEYKQLLEQRRKLDMEIENQMNKVMTYSSRLLSILPRVAEVVIEPSSHLIDKTLMEVDFRKYTESTVLAIDRKGEEIFSIDENIVIKEGDCLMLLMSSDNTKKVEEFVNRKAE